MEHATTPLGEPMDQASASERARDPLTWHLRYWLNLDIIAALRDEDVVLTGIRIDMEHEKIADPMFQIQLRTAWRQFQIDHLRASMLRWIQKTLDDQEAQKYVRDLDRMLVDKGLKMQARIRRMEHDMDESARTGHFPAVLRQLSLHRLARQRLHKEEEKDARVGNERSTNGDGIQEDQAEGIEMDDLDGDSDTQSDGTFVNDDDVKSGVD